MNTAMRKVSPYCRLVPTLLVNPDLVYHNLPAFLARRLTILSQRDNIKR
jgi:hypothetical protein